MNDKNASLQERLDRVNMTQGTAAFLLKALSGYQFEIVEMNNKKCIVWTDGVRMGGMQELDTFIRGLDANTSANMETARLHEITRMKAAIAAVQNGQNPRILDEKGPTYTVYEAFEKAAPAEVNNCVDQSAKFTRLTNVSTIENSFRGIIQASMLDGMRATQDLARDIRNNWDAIVK